MFYNLNRYSHNFIPVAAKLTLSISWVCIRIDLIGASFTSALAAYLVYWRPSGAGNIGFSLNMAGRSSPAGFAFSVIQCLCSWFQCHDPVLDPYPEPSGS